MHCEWRKCGRRKRLDTCGGKQYFESGADVITGGTTPTNAGKSIKPWNSDNRIIRPGNYPPGAPGRGYCVVNNERGAVAVINLLGVVYMEPLGCPFETLDKLLEELGPPEILRG